MEQDNWDADMRLKKYIYDYLLKRKFHATAEAFMAEGEVPTGPVAIDAPEGFLFEWWSVFWDIFVARNDASHSEPATAYLEIQRMKAREEQNMAMQQQNAQLQRGNLNHSPHGGSSINIHPDGVTGQPSMSPLAMNNAQSMELEISDASSIAFLRSAIERQSQLLPCNSGNMSVEQQIPSRAHLDAEVNTEVMDAAQNSMPLDPSIYGQATLQSKSRLGEADASGQNQGVTSLPLKDGPLIPSVGHAKNEGSMKMSQMQQSSSLPQDQLLQQQQVSQQMSSSGPADSTGTENTASPSPASPQSTHRAAPGEGTTAASSMCQTAQKNISPEGNEVLEFTSYLLDDLDHFGVLVSLDKEVDSFLTSDGGAGNNFSGTREEDTKGIEFPLGEIGCIRKGNSIVTCCHFSSDGKFLASAGHDKKVTFWNMDTLQTVTTPEEHKSVVTDVRFRPNSTYLASASVDQSVRLWDAANPSFYLRAYTGHTSPIMSLDFNPVKTELCCFCDDDNEIHYLDVNTFNCTRSCKGGSAQVRFQATAGKLLAAASDKVVSIFDVETDTQLHTFQGHPDMVSYICWNPHGEYLASVSQNMVKVWSLTSGQSIQEHFSTKANQFHSCDFHPDYLHVLVIGGVSCLDMWSIAENKSILIPAHENIISALSHTSVSNLVASASHDSYVKIWK